MASLTPTGREVVKVFTSCTKDNRPLSSFALDPNLELFWPSCGSLAPRLAERVDATLANRVDSGSKTLDDSEAATVH
jgi:hypothetical protein